MVRASQFVMTSFPNGKDASRALLRRSTIVLLAVLVGVHAPAAAADAKAKAAAKAAADDDEDILGPIRDEKAAPPTPAVEKSARVGVMPMVPLGDAGKPLADQLTVDLIKAFNESATVGFQSFGLPSNKASGGSDGGSAKKKEGDAELARARALVDKLKLGAAKTSFEKALSLYREGAAALVDVQPLIDCYVGMAEVAARGAQDDEADALLRDAAALNPDVQLDKARYPNLFLNKFKTVRDNLLRGERGSLFVDESGNGAAVVVDGREANSAPVRVESLPPGPHLVRALREGQTPWGVVVDVAVGKETKIEPGFFATDQRGPDQELALNRLTRASVALVAEAAKTASLKGVVLGAVAKVDGKTVAQLFFVDANDGKVARLATTTVSAGLLDVAIESLKAREGIEEAIEGDLALGDVDGEAVIDGASAGDGVTVGKFVMRYETKVSREPTKTRTVVDDDAIKRKTKSDDKVDRSDDDDDDRDIAAGGSKSGKRLRMDDKGDVLGGSEVDDEDSITAQGWFWPVVIAGSAVGVVAIGGAVVVGLVAGGVLPDPRPAAGVSVKVRLPATNAAVTP
jgi:hypothetical protein